MGNKTKKKMTNIFQRYLEENNNNYRNYNYIYQKIAGKFQLEEMEKERIRNKQKEKNVKVVGKLPSLSVLAYEKMEEIDEKLKKGGLMNGNNMPYIRAAVANDILDELDEGNTNLIIIASTIENSKQKTDKYIDIKRPNIINKIKNFFKPKNFNKLDEIDKSIVEEETNDYNSRCIKILTYNLESNVIDSLIKKMDERKIENPDEVYSYIQRMEIRKELTKIGLEAVIPEFEKKINKKYGIVGKRQVGRWTISIGKEPDSYENEIIRNNRKKIVMSPGKIDDSKNNNLKKDGFEIDD